MASSARTKNEEEEIVVSKTKTKLSRVERDLRRVGSRVEDYKNRTGRYSKEIVHDA